MTRIVGLQRHMGKLIATPREIICFHQQEPIPQSPVMKIVPSFPGTCSFNIPQCSSLNKIRVSTVSFIKNFFFWWSPLFAHVNLPTTILPPFASCQHPPLFTWLPSHFFHLHGSLLSYLSQLTTLPTTNRSLQNRNVLPIGRQGKHVWLIGSYPWRLVSEMLPSHSGI